MANRTLSGMGPEYVADWNHINPLRELNKFADFLKDRTTLVNNEFGDLTASSSKEKESVKRRD